MARRVRSGFSDELINGPIQYLDRSEARSVCSCFSGSSQAAVDGYPHPSTDGTGIAASDVSTAVRRCRAAGVARRQVASVCTGDAGVTRSTWSRFHPNGKRTPDIAVRGTATDVAIRFPRAVLSSATIGSYTPCKFPRAGHRRASSRNSCSICMPTCQRRGTATFRARRPAFPRQPGARHRRRSDQRDFQLGRRHQVRRAWSQCARTHDRTPFG